MKAYENLKEVLEDEIKKIAKKGDITPQELDSAYKAVDVLKDIDYLMGAEQEKSEGQSFRGNSYNSYANNSMRGGSYNSYGPIWNRDMMPYSMDMSNRGSYDGMSNRGSYDGRRGRDGDSDGRYSEDGEGGSYNYSTDSSYRRGRDARTGRYVSRDSGSYRSREYSRHAEKEHMIEKLEDMMEYTTTEKDRRAIMQCIDKLEG